MAPRWPASARNVVWQGLVDRSVLVPQLQPVGQHQRCRCLRVTVERLGKERPGFLSILASGSSADADCGPLASPGRPRRRRSPSKLVIDGSGRVEVGTGLPFFDHMVSQLGKHAGWDLVVEATGDLTVDAHHTVEDVGICLGQALRQALGDRSGVRRFASISVPLDEALIEVALDLSGRPFLVYEVDPGAGGEAYPLGDPAFDPQLAEEFWRAFVTSAAVTLHLRMRSGRNSHHILEASFKGVAPGVCATPCGWTASAFPRPRVLWREAVGVIAVLDYGIGSLRSAEKALQRVGADAVLARPTSMWRCVRTGWCCLASAPLGAAWRPCEPAGWTRWCSRAVEQGTPLLGICVGMQMLYDGSDEDPAVAGLGVLPGTLHRLGEA